MLACTGPVVHLAYGTLFTAVRDDLQGFAPMATRSLRDAAGRHDRANDGLT